MQKQLSKKIEREIRILAAKLPTAYYECNVYHKIPTDKINTGDIEVEGIKLGEKEDGKLITAVQNTARPVNHVLRMKRIYKRQGAVGVLNYVRGMIDLNADHPRELSLGGIQFTL